MTEYCEWCGNHPPVHDKICENCDKLITGTLESAKEAFDVIADHYGVCCKGIKTGSSMRSRPVDDCIGIELPENLAPLVGQTEILEIIDTSHLYVHPKGSEANTDAVSVECGVTLYFNHARCYWIYDSDRAGFTEGREYGPEIPYRLGAEVFLEVVRVVLGQAAQYAENCGVLSCPHCGDHHHESFTCDCQDDDVENGEEAVI